MNSFVCQYCLENFKTTALLSKHQKHAKYCISYMDVLFSCKKCNYTTVGIKNIDKHMEENICNSITEKDSINDYIIDEESIDENTMENDGLISKLENTLKVEKIKNSIYKCIIENNIPIKLDNILKENERELHIYESNLSKLGIYIHKNEKEEIFIKTDMLDIRTENRIIRPSSPCASEHDSVDNSEKNTKSYKSYKSYKTLKSSCIDLVLEPDKELIDNKIRDIDMSIYNIKRSFGDKDKSKLLFKKSFEEIKQNKTYTKNIEEIKKTRINLLGTLSFNEYLQLLKDQIKMLENILKDKGHNDKKITTTISKFLNSLDSRLLLYGNYYDIPMDIEEVSKFRICLDLSIKSYTYYTPFIFNDSIKLFFNYGSILSSVKMCIETYLLNRYGFNNIIYIPLKNSSKDDPYSFYILQEVNKDKRYWKMDCRLVELSEGIISNLKPFLINIFRKIYQDIFNDNDYRENYHTKTEITGSDFEQLICNIFILNDTLNFYNMMRNIIVDKSTYIPTENDKVNIFGDDLLIKKKFSKTKENVDKTDIVKLLFDNITNEQAVDLYRSKMSVF